MKKLLVLAVALACSIPAFAFDAKQTQPQIDAKFRPASTPSNRWSSLPSNWKERGVAVDPISLALVKYGSFDAVLVGLLKAGYDSGDAVKVLIARGADPKVMTTTALANGADPAKVTAATASGTPAAGTPAAGTPAPALPTFAGFTGNTFTAVPELDSAEAKFRGIVDPSRWQLRAAISFGATR